MLFEILTRLIYILMIMLLYKLLGFEIAVIIVLSLIWGKMLYKKND